MKLKRTHIISFANQKGGCGKTTGAVSIAAAFNRLGYSSCVVDTDEQCNATDTFGVNRDELQKEGKFTLADVYLAKKAARDVQINVEGEEDDTKNRPMLVPGHRGLGSVEKRLEAQLQAKIAEPESSPLDADDIRRDHRNRLKNSLDTLRGLHDFVVIDTPPDLDFLMTTALIASDWYVIPVFPSGYDLNGLAALTRTVDKVRKRYNAKLQLLGVLLGNYHSVAKLDRDIRDMLAQKFGENHVFKHNVGSSVRHREATVYSRTIFEHAPGQPQSENYLQIAREIVERVEPANASETKVETNQGQKPVDPPPQPEPVVVADSMPEPASLEKAVSNG